MQVLIVDDQPEVRRLLSITLSKSYEILEAEDGLSALEVVRERRPAVVLLDLMLPGAFNGFQVLDAIRADPHLSGVWVAVISARSGRTDFDDADHGGADAYFVKPFSPQQVAAWVHEALGSTTGRRAE